MYYLFYDHDFLKLMLSVVDRLTFTLHRKYIEIKVMHDEGAGVW